MTDRHEQKRATMAANLEAKTGKSVGEWAALVGEAGIEGFNQRVLWLKTHHGFGHFQARLVAEACREE